MSLGSGSLNKLAFRLSAIALSLAFAGEALALGLGELLSTPNLGERPFLEVEILGSGKELLDPACFRLRSSAKNDDLPSLKRVTFAIRKGTPPILQIRSEQPLREPIIQFAIHVACGHEIVRDYIILASPEPVSITETVPHTNAPIPLARPDEMERRDSSVPKPPRPKAKPSRRSHDQLQPIQQARATPRVKTEGISDRLMLSGGGDVGEPSLRLSTEMRQMATDAGDIGEEQREILRLEFRTLLALNEQATTQLAAAEKLRRLEASLSELQRRSSEITQKVEQGVAASTTVSTPPVAVVPQPVSKPFMVPEERSLISEWGLYSLLLGALLGVGGWLGWRNYRERQERAADDDFALVAPEFQVDPQRSNEREELGGLDLDVDPAVMGGPMQVDFPLDTDDASVASPLPKTPAVGTFDSMMSIAAATVDEHFEANPVMELADIMLSFGRVKGAAQALQEYIDHNPQEALQPWIRLMDVYRMAGLRTEFDNVARNLNQHFNVEIQQWDPAEPALNRHTLDMVLDDDAGLEVKSPPPPQPKVESLEDLTRIMQQVTTLWRDGDVVAYLQQLLRDNREGKRAGFPLQVVSDMLFLIDLKEIINKTSGN